MWRDVVDLGDWQETITHGEPVRALVWTTVFANKKSVRASEFYQAMNVGMKPELVFEIRSAEYEQQEMLRYNDHEYSILRTYDKGEFTELVVSSQVGADHGQ